MNESPDSQEPKVFHSDRITLQDLDPDALKVVERLKQFDFEAFFVGGCVRDLLVGQKPKDFDIATSARPRQIKRLFRNCRIIGRRFKLAHILFGKRIIETATFRKSPSDPSGPEESPESPEQWSSEKENEAIATDSQVAEPDLLITDDNLFGNAEQDARRRDFTVNALFFDPQSQQVIDYVGGHQDLVERKIRTIGDPYVRFREDPVRILRAVKFATRLGFQIEETAFQAMKEISPDLARSAAPRILEEILRLLKGGHARPSFTMLRDLGALGVILPEVQEFINAEEQEEPQSNPDLGLMWNMLEALDQQVQSGKTPSTALALSCLFYPMLKRRLRLHGAAAMDLSRILSEMSAPLARRTRIPRFELGRMQRICIVQRRFTQRPGRRFRPNHFVRQDYFLEALGLFHLYSLASGMGNSVYESWRKRLETPAPTVPTRQAHPQGTGQRAPVLRQTRQAVNSKPKDDPDRSLLRDEEKDPTWGDW